VRLESFRIGEDEAPYMRVMGRPKRRGFYRPSDLLGYEHEPDIPGRTNRYGMMGRRDRAHPLAKAPGVCRVLLLGDSIAEPWWSADTLEAELNSGERYRRRWKSYEVWNGGTGSYLMRAEAWLAARDGGPGSTMKETGRRYVREILETGRARSLPVVFVVFPYLEPPGRLDERQRLEYATITGVLSETGAAWLDLSGLFEGMRRRGAPLRYKPHDIVHPSAKAHEGISREIGSFLTKARLL